MIKGKCNKCGTESMILPSHVGKRHKKCGNRKKGEPRINCGRWEKVEEEK